jgi:phosphomannomutase
MSPKFGTSGVRGLAIELTDDVITSYVQAFLTSCEHGGTVHIGRDLRASSPQISAAVSNAVRFSGLDVVEHGEISTPALAYFAMSRGHGSIMITGSHIPEDRNGLKFYTSSGEITKDDEVRILENFGRGYEATRAGHCQYDTDALDVYVARYVDGFGEGALSGLRIGLYEHSSVARDVLRSILEKLGVDVVSFERSEIFIPIDTEAVECSARQKFQTWCRDFELDAIVSTDGDGDRPLVTDEFGALILGDVLGPLTASLLNADAICTPISSNSLVDQLNFENVNRTKIGSPYVIAAMQEVGGTVVGYEANGGFILGYDASGPNGQLAPLITRDCVLPILGSLSLAKQKGITLSELVASLPSRVTASDRLSNIPSDWSRNFIDRLLEDRVLFSQFFGDGEHIKSIDVLDGLRVTRADSTIIHFRPSGNAPEFRCYVEAHSTEAAKVLLESSLRKVKKQILA